MAENKGKPSGNDAKDKKDVGRKADYKRSGWPEDAPTQRLSGKMEHGRTDHELDNQLDEERNRKAGGDRIRRLFRSKDVPARRN